ncbi:alpha/beta fold hydrolase [Persicimonas caeni]|nr:alpha/beta hydrolase [Persicimonas caeni]
MTALDDLNIVRYGSGPTKVISYHGWGADHRKSFKYVIEKLPEHVSFWGVDLPGCGRSPRPSVFNYPEVASILTQSFDDIVGDGETATLLGACSGAYHGLEIARQRPDKVDKLVMVDSMAYFPWFLGVLLAPGVGTLLFEGVFSSQRGRKAIQKVLEATGVANAFDVMESFGRIDLGAAYRYLEFYDEMGTVDQYMTVNTPTTLLWGTHTWKVVLESVKMWRATLPNFTEVQVEGVGHLINQEAPEVVVEALLDATGESARDAARQVAAALHR